MFCLAGKSGRRVERNGREVGGSRKVGRNVEKRWERSGGEVYGDVEGLKGLEGVGGV